MMLLSVLPALALAAPILQGHTQKQSEPQPDFTVVRYQLIEKAAGPTEAAEERQSSPYPIIGPVPDFDAPENFYVKSIERYYIVRDTRKMTRSADGSVWTGASKQRWSDPHTAAKQYGPALVDSSGQTKFRYVTALGQDLGGSGIGQAQFVNQKVQKGQELVECMVRTEVQDVESRYIAGKLVRRVRISHNTGATVTGFSSDMTWDPTNGGATKPKKKS